MLYNFCLTYNIILAISRTIVIKVFGIGLFTSSPEPKAKSVCAKIETSLKKKKKHIHINNFV